MTSLKLGGYDPLDAQLDDVTVVPERPGERRPSRMPLAGWSASSVPVASLLVLGMILGPRGISVLPTGALSLLDPAIPVALAALGALVGLSIEVRGRRRRRTYAMSLLQSALAALLVAVPLVLVPPSVLAHGTIPLWIFAASLGVCAASSLAVPASTSDDPGDVYAGLLELDPVLPILAGGLLLGLFHPGGAGAALALVGQVILISALLSGGVWLLLARAASDTEQRVFAFAAMLLIGGVADYLSISALLCGLVAGMIWQVAGGQARESLRRDVLYTQHSLLVLVLVVAGARTEFSLAASGAASVYVLLRLAAKLLGGVIAARAIDADEPRTAALQLLSPGVFGIALALNIVRAAGPDAAGLLTIVVLGTIGSEITAELARTRNAGASDRDPMVSV